MTTIAIGRRLVHRARFHGTWIGRWVLRVWFDGEPPTGKVTVHWGSTQLPGTVLQNKSGASVGEGVATIVGGAGWHNEPPATWLVNAMATPAQVAHQLAQAVGENLVVSAGALRPGRLAYARARQPASDTLRDLLADGALWWVELDGTTRAATDHPSPALSSDIVLEYDPEARVAKLDILEPSQVPIGGVIPAASERFPELRIYSIDIEASEEGVLTMARTEPPVADVPHVAALLQSVMAGAPVPAHATWRTATVQSQDAQRRPSLRFEERDKELADPLPVRAFCGVPGVSAEVFTGTRTLLAFDRADPTNPIAAMWSPFGEPGHVPRKVYHEAAEEIRFFIQSSGIMRVGLVTQAVALAPLLQTYLIAHEAYLEQLHLAVTPLVSALPDGGTAYNTARSARMTAAVYSGPVATFPFLPATKLEAQ